MHLGEQGSPPSPNSSKRSRLVASDLRNDTILPGLAQTPPTFRLWIWQRGHAGLTFTRIIQIALPNEIRPGSYCNACALPNVDTITQFAAHRTTRAGQAMRAGKARPTLLARRVYPVLPAYWVDFPTVLWKSIHTAGLAQNGAMAANYPCRHAIRASARCYIFLQGSEQRGETAGGCPSPR